MQRQILVVDDEQPIREYLSFILLHNGFRPVESSGGKAALEQIAARGDEIGMVVSDIGMAGMSGIDLLRRVRLSSPGMPFVLLSGACDQSLAIEAYRFGASEYLLKPVSEKGFIDAVRKHCRDQETWDQNLIQAEVYHFVSGTVDSVVDRPARLNRLFRALGGRRFETMQHSQRVATFSRLIAMNWGLRGKDLAELEIGALLHDIGKVAIPQNVIEKPGHLTADEWRVMKLHPAIGASLLRDIPGCNVESGIVLSHHERFDGLGYPNGLSGLEIPVGARVFLRLPIP